MSLTRFVVYDCMDCPMSEGLESIEEAIEYAKEWQRDYPKHTQPYRILEFDEVGYIEYDLEGIEQ